MKNIRSTVLLLLLLGFAFNAYSQEEKFPFKITVFKGKNVLENAFLINSGNNLLLIDALSSGGYVKEIIKAVEGRKLSTIFITHGHPDHFMGLAALLKNNPEAAIYTGSEGVKRDIIAYATLAESKGLLESEPEMKIRSAKNSKGFDYNRIKIITNNNLEIGDGHSLTIENIDGSAESEHNTILYSPRFNLLFASDLLYNKVYNWLGPGVDQRDVDHWIKTLKDLKTRFGKPTVVIYPGHGEKTDHTLFDINIHYLNSFKAILSRTKSKPDALTFFKQVYPDYQGEFLLSRSIDHLMDSTLKENYISINNIQDLTHTLTPDFPYIPVPNVTFPFEAQPIAIMEKHGVRANKWIIHEHIGTQVDAPNHFAPNGLSLEALNVQDMIVPVVVIDISKKCLTNPDAELTLNDIKQWETIYGTIPVNACVMMYSGWEKFLFEEKYIGIDKTHTKHFPGISLEAIQFLLSARTISGVGVDVISLDPGYDHAYKGHKILLGAGKWALEAVANLQSIPPRGAYLFVGIPKVKGATGGIVRLLAVW